jgi:uncharacterized protein (TIGR00299 family) protein
LSAREGAGKTLFLDAFSGIAGDMTIAALVDLGVPFEVVEGATAALGLSGYRLELRRSEVSALGATKFDVVVETEQPERTYRSIERLLREAPLDARVIDLAARIFRRLAEAESEVHRVPIETVHFHEVGAVDAIVDVVGAAACFCYLDAEVVATPLPMGRGFVTCRHGVLPLPAPATLLCLRGAPTRAAGVEAELVTPTGAAIAATVVTRWEDWPAMTVDRVGMGAGSRVLPDRLNALRALLGSSTAQSTIGGETHVVLEANVDDLTGELAAHAIEALFRAGAVDAWATPISMKKGRPALTIAALAPRHAEARVVEALLAESTTIGLRRSLVGRVERPRRMIEVTTRYGPIPVKVSGGPYGPPQVKPEFEACARAASNAGVPVRVVIAEALAAYGALEVDQSGRSS